MKWAGQLRTLPPRADGTIRFEIKDENAEPTEYLCTLAGLAQIITDLKEHFDSEVEKRGITQTAPQIGKPTATTFRLSRFGVLPGQDGIPRIVIQLEDGTTSVIQLTKKDSLRLIEMLKSAVETFNQLE